MIIIANQISPRVDPQEVMKIDSIHQQCSKFLRNKSEQEYFESIFQRGSKTER